MDIRKIKETHRNAGGINLGEIEIKEGEESIRISRAGSAAPVAQWMHARHPHRSLLRRWPRPPAEPANRAHGHLTMSARSIAAVAERRVVRGGRQPGEGRRYPVHHRSDEILNTIESDKAGTVKAILKENGQPWSSVSAVRD